MMVFTTLYGLVTLGLIIAFVVLCLWAYSPKRHDEFSRHSAIPLELDGDNQAGQKS